MTPNPSFLRSQLSPEQEDAENLSILIEAIAAKDDPRERMFQFGALLDDTRHRDMIVTRLRTYIETKSE